MASRFVLRLCAAALVSGILMELNRDGPTGQLLKVLCGLFVLLTALGPLGTLSLPELPNWEEQWREEAAAAVAEGEDYARENRETGITQRLSAYILDKAAQLGLEVDVRVTLSREGIPNGAELTGRADPAQKAELEKEITKALGIPKEAVRWMEP